MFILRTINPKLKMFKPKNHKSENSQNFINDLIPAVPSAITHSVGDQRYSITNKGT